MSTIIKLLVVMIILIQCKAKEQIETNTSETENSKWNNSFITRSDTIYCSKNDTVFIELPVEFSKGRIWRSRDTVQQISFFKHDEIQKYNKQELKDFQKFYYVAKDTGKFTIQYQLTSPYGKDTTLYEVTSKFFIIKQ